MPGTGTRPAYKQAPHKLDGAYRNHPARVSKNKVPFVKSNQLDFGEAIIKHSFG